MFGAKRTNILFTSHKKGIIRFSDGKEDVTVENVTSIDVLESPAGATVNVVTKEEDGSRSIGSGIGNIREIIIVE